jgi:hypothetical protein
MAPEPPDSDSTSSDDEEDAPLGVPEDRLPDDLQRTEDNPLAQPADDVPDDVLEEDAGTGGSDGDSGDAAQGGDDVSNPSSGAASSGAGPGTES